MNLTKFWLIVLCACTLIQIHAQDTHTIFYNDGEMSLDSVSYNIRWDSFAITTHIHIRWVPNTAQQYINPSKAYTLSQTKYPAIFSEIITRLSVHKQSNLLDYVRTRSAYKEVLSLLLNNTVIFSQTPDKDLMGTTIALHTSIESLMQGIIMPGLSVAAVPTIPYPQAVAQSYTSIIFAVNKPLFAISDLDSTNAIAYQPKFLPRVFAEQRYIMVYSPEYYNPSNPSVSNNYRAYRYIYEENYPYANTGNNPLLIVPIALDSQSNGDIIISSEDTKLIFESQSSNNLMKEGKVFFIIPAQTTEEISR